MKKRIFFDIECYVNYFLVCFKSDTTTRFYELSDGHSLNISEIKEIMCMYTSIGFGSRRYDIPMLSYAVRGASNMQLKKLSDTIINLSRDNNIYDLLSQYNLYKNKQWDTIDISEPIHSINKGLKMYGARCHTGRIQELPIEPDTILTYEQMVEIRNYCENDVIITRELYNKIYDKLQLRVFISEEFGHDMRSYSDATIAEKAFKLNLPAFTKIVPETVKYSKPDNVNFRSKDCIQFLDDVSNIEYKIDSHGKIVKNPMILNKVSIDGVEYSVGIGGLHSNEEAVATIASEDEFIVDIDVTSYYPSIILNNKYSLENIEESFLNLYQKFFDKRLKAKQDNNQIASDVYKIVLNSVFGKFGSKYSFLYSPSLLLHTTISGQLSLLMLIESLGFYGFKVISANTDGVVVKGKRVDNEKFEHVIKSWELHTNYKLESVFYKSIYQEYVNSYIAIKEDNSLKLKGSFVSTSLDHNPRAWVSKKAVIKYLRDKVAIDETILKGTHLKTDFLTVRKVKGGAMFRGKYLGNIVRWYYAKHDDCIHYKSNGNRVASTMGATPLMDLSVSFENLDHQRYIDESYKLLNNIGVKI